MDHTLFIHSFISGHLGCLELVATVNNAAMNVGVQISVHVPTSDSVYILPEMACLPLDAHVPLSLPFFLHCDISVGSALGKQDEGCPPLPSHPIFGNVHHYCPLHQCRDSGLPAVWR